jgi:hypothetical protein
MTLNWVAYWGCNHFSSLISISTYFTATDNTQKFITSTGVHVIHLIIVLCVISFAWIYTKISPNHSPAILLKSGVWHMCGTNRRSCFVSTIRIQVVPFRIIASHGFSTGLLCYWFLREPQPGSVGGCRGGRVLHREQRGCERDSKAV